MKKLILSLVASMLATVFYAQNLLVATLTHEGNVSMYYGVYALQNAMIAAASGDIITLSGGAFQAVDIEKAVTLRGVGIDDAIPTCIAGDFTINIQQSDTSRMSMEGINCTGGITMDGEFANAYFRKCQYFSISCPDTSIITNIMFVNCKIIAWTSWYGNCTLSFINSYVNGLTTGTTSSASFINCVILPTGSGHGLNPESTRNSYLENCIIYGLTEDISKSLPSTSTAINCVSINYTDLFKDVQIKTGCTKSTFQEIFKNFTGTYDSESFELTDSAKTTFVGTDGTEVGWYGGIAPYSSVPSYPLITQLNVSPKTSGILNVNINVSNPK